MRITKQVVEKAAELASDYTDGAFGHYIGSGQDIGNGTRYLGSGHVWTGPNASQNAAAYYVGLVYGWSHAVGISVPTTTHDFCTRVQESYAGNTTAVQWEEQGRLDAQTSQTFST